MYHGHMSESAITPSKSIRVGVLDNDCCALECEVALLQRLARQDQMDLDVWSTDNPARAIQECRFGAKRTNVMIIDVALNGITGAQVAVELRRQESGIGIIGITSYQPQIYERCMRDSGAQALLDKSALRQTLSDAIGMVAQGLPYPDGAVFVPVRQACAAMDRHVNAENNANLTQTERQILALSLTPLSTKEIASTLHVTVDTVFSHRRNIKNKMRSNTWHDVMDYCRAMHIA